MESNQIFLVKMSAFILIILSINITFLIYSDRFDNPFNKESNDSTIIKLYYLGNASDFTLPNIKGENYTFSDDLGLVRIVNFMYTKCPGDSGCSLLTNKLAILFNQLKQEELTDKIRLISIDFDYINDTLQDLKKYASLYTQDFDRWQFLLGSKNQTDEVALDWNFYFEINNQTNNSKLQYGDENRPDPYLHMIILYIVDKQSIFREYVFGNTWNSDLIMQKIKILIDE